MRVAAVWVVKTVGSRPDHEDVVGDGMAKILYAAGCIGVVTDGGVRDVSGLLATPFAAYSRGRTIHHCAMRIKALNQPIEIGGITIRAGDVIHANNEGVIKIPAGCLGVLAARATQMRAYEQDVHRLLRRTDVSVAAKRRTAADLFLKYGFGEVATKTEP
jgi:regulator of RNase E activity RraA